MTFLLRMGYRPFLVLSDILGGSRSQVLLSYCPETIQGIVNPGLLACLDHLVDFVIQALEHLI